MLIVGSRRQSLQLGAYAAFNHSGILRCWLPHCGWALTVAEVRQQREVDSHRVSSNRWSCSLPIPATLEPAFPWRLRSN